MKLSDREKWREDSLSTIRQSKIWLWFGLVVTLVLFCIEQAPYTYLLVMSSIGVLCTVILALSWRYSSMWIFMTFVIFMSASSTLTERFFGITSQYQDVQGVTLAITFAGVTMAIFRDRLIRYIRQYPLDK
jgi:hypothetical protein